MITFIIGMVILILGGAAYGRICERVIKPDDRETPAVRLEDGVDFVPMKKWKNCLIQLLNIAGTGPIFGPIQGILFGPIAFLTIPVGCVLGGAFHDYMSGMASIRNDGAQMPSLINKYLGKYVYFIYNVFICLLLVLVGAVFIYTPGDLFVSQILKADSSISNPVIWFVYGVIFVYYVIATLFPVDKIIGRIYPIFGGILLLSALGVSIGIFIKGYPLDEIWETGVCGIHPQGLHFVPIFFVTVACGIVSGFHSTQSTLISRTMKYEKEGRMTFYNMMIVEGFIAMVWAAAAMGAMKLGLADVSTSTTGMVGIVANDLLGSVGGAVAIIGIIVLPITSGDTALRSMRLIIADALHIDQGKRKNRLFVALAIFVMVAILLLFSKMNSDGFQILWRYFAWANQVIAVFAFAMIAVYMMREIKKTGLYMMALLPGMFYMFVVGSFILNSSIGFGLSWTASYLLAGVLAAVYAVGILYTGKSEKEYESLRK